MRVDTIAALIGLAVGFIRLAFFALIVYCLLKFAGCV